MNFDTNHFSVWISHLKIFVILKNIVDDVLLFWTKKINETFPRDDYKEFIELITIFLEKTTTRGTRFWPPGVYHLARWIVKGLYYLKILFCEQFKLPALEKSCTFYIWKYYHSAKICYGKSVNHQNPSSRLIFLLCVESFSME